MAKQQWTPQQAAALTHRKGTLLVSAAAGSGKTAVLVERALRLVVEDKVDIDRLLIVTFTNAAAAELKARLSEGLEELQATADPSQRQWLRRQKTLLQRASICTADAFCLELIRQNFFRLDLPADIAVGDFGLLNTLCRQSVEKVQEEFASNEYFAAFGGMYGKSKDDSTAEAALLELYRFFSTQPDRDLLRKRMLLPWQQTDSIEQTPWGSQLLKQVEQLVDTVYQTAKQLSLLEPPFVEKWTKDKWEKYTKEILSQVEEIYNNLPLGWDAVRRQVQIFRVPVARPALPAESEQCRLRDSIKELMEEIRQLMPCTAQEDLQDRQVAAPVIEAVLQAEQRFEELFFAAKKENRVLEFSDVEQLALQLLWDSEAQTPTDFAREIANGFHQVMVDEYQDTNALQGRLYQCVASAAQDNLFLVGDIKQSIYRFRHAAPDLFQEKRKAYADFDGKTFPANLTLNANFRSLPQVLDGVNDFFRQLMSPLVGEVEYNQEEWLNSGLQQAGVPLPDGAPILFDVVLEEEKEQYGDAWQVAWRIQDLVTRKVPVRCKDGTRPVEYGDFCILMRTKGQFELYQRALNQWNIPSYVDVGADLLQAPEVQPLASLLRALDRPADDVQLAAVLTGPLAGFGMELLVQLRLVQKKGSLYSTLLAWQKAYQQGLPIAEAVSSPSAQRLEEFLQRFDFWRSKSSVMESQQFCQLILQQTNWAQAVGSSPMGSQRRKRLEEFLSWVQQAGKNGLPALVKAIEDAANSGEGIPEMATGTPEGCVSIMTIHRSKGLEFPVVILADTFRQFNFSDLKKPFALHPREGIAIQLPGVTGKYDTAAMVWMRRVLRREMLSEEMRVLYVALTRAKDLLCIVGMVGNENTFENKKMQFAQELQKGISPYWVEKKHTAGDWLFAVAMLHPDGAILRKDFPIFSNPECYTSKMQLSVRYSGQGEPDQQQQEEESIPENTALWNTLQQQFAWKDPFAPLATIDSKVSVSQITHKDQQFTWQPAKPAFARSRSTMTGAQRGTAAHRFLQLAKLEKFTNNPAMALEKEIQRMVEQNLMDEDSAAVLDKRKLLEFFASPLYQRMCRAMEPPCRLLREFAFITGIPASQLSDTPKKCGDATVLLQGVADLVLVFPDHGELIDYKTDYVQQEQALVQRYTQQLSYYKTAVEKRIGVPITKCSLYSLHLNKEIPVDLSF